MTLDEAIKHCEEKAKELKEEAHSYSDDKRYSGAEADCLECAREHEQLAEWLKELKYLSSSSSYAELTALRKFAKFVSAEVCNDYFQENADSFAEVACRKLVKLGLVELDGNTYKPKIRSDE